MMMMNKSCMWKKDDDTYVTFCQVEEQRVMDGRGAEGCLNDWERERHFLTELIVYMPCFQLYIAHLGVPPHHPDSSPHSLTSLFFKESPSSSVKCLGSEAIECGGLSGGVWMCEWELEWVLHSEPVPNFLH